VKLKVFVWDDDRLSGDDDVDGFVQLLSITPARSSSEAHWHTITMDGQRSRYTTTLVDISLCSHICQLCAPTTVRHTFSRPNRAVKCRLIWHFRGQALLLRVLHVVACDNVRDCIFLKDDLNRVKKGFISYELNFSLPTNSQNKLNELN